MLCLEGRSTGPLCCCHLLSSPSTHSSSAGGGLTPTGGTTKTFDVCSNKAAASGLCRMVTIMVPWLTCSEAAELRERCDGHYNQQCMQSFPAGGSLVAVTTACPASPSRCRLAGGAAAIAAPSCLSQPTKGSTSAADVPGTGCRSKAPAWYSSQQYNSMVGTMSMPAGTKTEIMMCSIHGGAAGRGSKQPP